MGKTLKKNSKIHHIYIYIYIYILYLYGGIKGGNTWGCDRRASAVTFFALIDVLLIW